MVHRIPMLHLMADVRISAIVPVMFDRLPRPAAMAGVICALLLAACAAPFVDRRREAGTVEPIGESTPDRVAICYNAATTTPAEIMAIAREACAETGRTPRLVAQTLWQCRLLQPTRVYFECVGTRQAESGRPRLPPGTDLRY